MRHDNVVPFDPARRGGLARRGSPDKAGEPGDRSVTLECPACASALPVDAEWLEGLDEVLCGKCESPVPLVSFRQERGAG